jgi:branched-chain amino acid transport system substrate-binding protein
VLTGRRALATASAVCLAALAVAGCSTTGSSSSSSSSSVKVKGHTLTIYISEPSDLATDQPAQDIVHAEQLAFSAHSGEVTDYKLSLQTVRYAQLSDNARQAIIDPSTIAYLGEIAPGTSSQTVGITNALDVLQVSPTDNALELGQKTPAVPGAPQNYFEQWGTYGRTFARMVPSGSEEATAQVAEMKSLGVTKLYVADDGSDYGKAIAHAVSSDAQAAGLTIEPSVDEEVNGYFYGAQSPSAAARFFNHIASMAPNARLFGPSSLNAGSFPAALSSAAAKHLYVSLPGYLPKDLPAAGKSFVSAFRTAYGHAPNSQAVFGYEAMSALLRVLQAEGNNANNRTSVVKAFLNQKDVPSVLGTYSINSAGNISLDAFVFARISGGQLVPFTAAPVS